MAESDCVAREMERFLTPLGSRVAFDVAAVVEGIAFRCGTLGHRHIAQAS
ncbi:MAG: hypothetical protein SVG88_09965 [Halobacteriales archaeon]|nr:hypothetical protein [Halobacteriales archaeon]